MKGVAIGRSQAGCFDAGHRVVSVHMHNRNLETFGQIAGVEGAAHICGIGGKAHLIVGDDVNGTARVVALQPR